MYKGYKVSVAMATYNGEKYIKEQLDSIIDQTVNVDEIVVSDDCSQDRTLDIVKEYINCNKHSIKMTLLTDNPHHGISGNYTWVIEHASGDIIFISGQDDVWENNKVEKVMDVFISHPEAEMVCHNLCCVDGNGDKLKEQKVNSVFINRGIKEGEVIHVTRDEYLSAVISSVLISGPAVCISKSLVQKCLPIPSLLPEDWWLQFCATADDSAYYIHLILTSYRIHDSTSHSAGMTSIAHLKKTISMMKTANLRSSMLLQFSDNARQYINSLNGYDVSDVSVRTLDRVEEIARKVSKAQSSGRVMGAILLTHLYLTDVRYRRIGLKNYLTQLGYTVLYSKQTIH